MASVDANNCDGPHPEPLHGFSGPPSASWAPCSLFSPGFCAGPPVRGPGPGILPTQGVLGYPLSMPHPSVSGGYTLPSGPGIVLSSYRVLLGFPARSFRPVGLPQIRGSPGPKSGTHSLSLESSSTGSFEARGPDSNAYWYRIPGSSAEGPSGYRVTGMFGSLGFLLSPV